MIDIELIRKQPQLVKDNLVKRGVATDIIDRLAIADNEWREAAEEADRLRAEQNEANKSISVAVAAEKKAKVDAMRQVAAQLKQVTQRVEQLGQERLTLWRSLPNLVMPDVPLGGEEDFEIVRVVPPEVPKSEFPQKSYLDLAQPHLIDIERAGKVSGSRFVYLKGPLARLQIGLVSYLFDFLAKNDFSPIIPPVLINEAAMAGMGYLDMHNEEIYRTQDNQFLVGTSEQSIGPMHMDEVLLATDLPLRYVGYSSCFRREAGSHGKDVRGMMRVHQFDKVEMFSITTPENSAAEHERLLSLQEQIVQALGLPYRVINSASRDLGMPAAKRYDIETWIPSESRYRETHSTSNTTDYQARRLNIRTKTGNSITKVHMLNGTAAAVGRLLIAIIENHQQADSTVHVPEVLHSYVPFRTIDTH